MSNTNKKKTRFAKISEFDERTENKLLAELRGKRSEPFNKHILLITIQNFYYKYRIVSDIYLNKCIEYCIMDIEMLDEVQEDYRFYEIKALKRLNRKLKLYSKEEIKNQGNYILYKSIIPSFKRLVIIYEKQKEYLKAIKVCDQAIEYYIKVDMPECSDEFSERKQKLQNKLNL